MGQLSGARTKYLGTGHGQNFRGGWCGEEQRKGDGFETVTGAISGQMQKGIRPRRSEADMRGLRGTGALLAATQGRKRRGRLEEVAWAESAVETGQLGGIQPAKIFPL
jgi:hypothetical protein